MYNRSVSKREHVSMSPMLNYVEKFARLIMLIVSYMHKITYLKLQ